MSEQISSIMQKIVMPVSMDDTIADVETMMDTHRISAAPVYDVDGAVLGIITVSDIARFQGLGKDPKSSKAWEICTYRPVEVQPDTPISEVAELMLTRKIHHVVVMENHALKGIVSALDFVRLFARQGNA